jgi:hypothetical protein
MKKHILGTIAGLALATAGLQAQVSTGVGGGIGVGRSGGNAAGALIEQFQQAGTMTAVAGGRGMGMITSDTNATVVGRPYSATEERNSTQTLGDGTEISTSESVPIYRDSAGRTRREMPEGRTVIVDPVAQVTVTLISATKTARRMSMLGSDLAKVAVALSEREPSKTTTSSASAVYTFSVGDGTSIQTVTTGGRVALPAANLRGGQVVSENMQKEDLGVESLNGVLATHTRNTLTIPQGQIGNNRDIHVVNDRWYSDDLQMMVKTVNSDPRFGKNTYELTNISRDEPNMTLFQIPSDYRIVDMGAGRGIPASPTTPPNK